MVRGIRNFFLAVYVPILLLYLIASYAMYMSPAEWWPVGFFSLIYPFVLVALIVLTAISIVIRVRYVFLGLIALVLSFNTIANIIPLRKEAHFTQSRAKEDVRIMSWNIRRFTPFYRNYFDPKHNNIRGILAEVERFDPDIICFQEFFTSKKNNEKTIADIRKMGYKYYVFARHTIYKTAEIEEGNIIFSKFPIIRKQGIDHARELSIAWEEPVFADVLVEEDTIRVGTFHLESYGFAQREYEDLAKLHSKDEEVIRPSKNIFSKMRYAFSQRGKQAELLHAEIQKSPYPLVICGDLNDVPSSYAYVTTRGKLKDAFLEQGAGLGKTFLSGRSRLLSWLPTLRIDYIFTDKRFEVKQFSLSDGSLSDHRGVISDFQLPKKQ